MADITAMPTTDTPGSTHTKSTSSHGHVDSPTTNHNTNTNASPRKSSGQHNTLSIRSCVTCRKRKVRCDKVHPSCGNCTKAHIECVFPGPGRAPRKSRKPPDTELLARLRRLEGVVQSLGAQVDDEGTVTQNGVVQSPRAMATIADQLHRSDSGRNSPGSDASGEAGYAHRASIDKQVGRLVINEGRSRYVSNAFWASMGDEISEMRDILDNPSEEDDDELDSPDQSNNGLASDNHQGFVFGYSSNMVNMRSLHPSPSQIFILWEVFKENVDPLVRVLHRPTAKNILINASSNTDGLSRSAEALLFAIYYGAVVSLTPEQCQSLLGESKDTLSKRYRFGTEQALARAGFLNSSSLMLLQAFVFFLICVRHQDDTRLVWSLGGLAIHLAQALGIHRDGTNFNLNPFETEMRRRLWWHISILDTRSSEEHGTDPTFSEQFYDTKLPMNINDDDIYPDMKEPPKERVGCTEMTFCLLRFELSVVTRRLSFTAPGVEGSESSRRTLEEKEKMIDQCHRMIEEKYLQYCDMNIPIYWVAATVGRLILAKMWLMAHHPLAIRSDVDSPSPTVKERLFITSVEVIEFSYLLEQNENTSKWGWLFRTYMQWHAVAFVLSELCIRPSGPTYERAWKAVESVFDRRILESTSKQKGMLWRPLRQLWTRAKAVRDKRPKNNMWSDGLANPSGGGLPKAFDPLPPSMNPGPPNGNAMGPTAYNLGVIHSTAEALGLDMDDYDDIGADNDLSQPPIPLVMDMDMNPDGTDVLPTNQNQPGGNDDPLMVQNWLGGATDGNDLDLQTNNDFLRWSGWTPGIPGDFDPMAGFPIMNHSANMAGAGSGVMGASTGTSMAQQWF